MNNQKAVFAVVFSLSFLLLINESIDLFYISGSFFNSNSIITTAILLNTVLFINYSNAPGNLKNVFFHKVINVVLPSLLILFLLLFLPYVIFQIYLFGIAEGRGLFNQLFTLIVVLFPLVFFIFIKFNLFKTFNFCKK